MITTGVTIAEIMNTTARRKILVNNSILTLYVSLLKLTQRANSDNIFCLYFCLIVSNNR